MPTTACPHCGERVERRFRFCPWCAGVLRVKITEFFRAYVGLADDAGKALRVSRYLGTDAAGRHVRFSVWNESGEAEAAVSLDEREASRLARGFGRVSYSAVRREHNELADRLVNEALDAAT